MIFIVAPKHIMIASWISKIVSFVADAAGNDVMVHVQALSEIAGFRHDGEDDVGISHGVISQPI